MPQFLYFCCLVFILVELLIRILNLCPFVNTVFLLHSFIFQGFNPVHIVVRESDSVDAFPAVEFQDLQSQSQDDVEETPIANNSGNSVIPPEDSPRSLRDTPIDKMILESLIVEEGDASSKEVGIQCDLIDFLAMLEEYHRNTGEDVTPWFVSAMNMSRDDTGMLMTICQCSTYTDKRPMRYSF